MKKSIKVVGLLLSDRKLYVLGEFANAVYKVN
jgi:hypothetical protein